MSSPKPNRPLVTAAVVDAAAEAGIELEHVQAAFVLGYAAASVARSGGKQQDPCAGDNWGKLGSKPAEPPDTGYKRLPVADFPSLRNDLVIRAALGQKTERVPVWMMRQAGRYLPEYHTIRSKNDFFSICRTPQLACEITLQPLKRFPTLDACIIFSDILVVPQSMGMEVEMVKGRGPVFPEPLVDPADMDRLNFSPDVNSTLGYVFDALNLTRAKIAGRVPLIGFCGAPWTLMAYMIEGGGSRTLSKAKTWLYRYPEASHKLLGAITSICVEYLVGQVLQGGAQLLQVFESWGGELNKKQFEAFSLPYLSRIATEVKQKVADMAPEAVPKTIPMTVFARNSHHALESLGKTSYDVLSLDWGIEPGEARNRLSGTNKSLQGNLDPCALYATPDVIHSEVEEMIEKFGTQAYIANLGHGMHPTMDPDNAHVFIKSVQQVSAQMNKDTD